jgi:DNA-3-methyladenine glycosylase II
MDNDTILSQLTTIRGVGPWTVEMLLIFKLGRADVLPVTDYGVRKGFALTYKLKDLPSAAELLAHGEKWRPYRSFAAWYLWRACD